MKKSLFSGWIAALALGLLVSPVGAENGLIPREPLSYSPTFTLPDLVKGNNALGLSLFHLLTQSTPNPQNMIFSPYSISTALAMAWIGARNNTASQMSRVLHFTGDPQTLGGLFQSLNENLNSTSSKGGFELKMANSLWLQNDDYFLQPFMDELDQDFNTPPMLVQFKEAESIRQEINQWVASRTDQKITDLFAPGSLNPDTKMVLVNALYFKAQWENSFKPTHTHSLPFHGIEGDIPVSMMRQQNKFLITENNEAQILDMPYQGGQISMIFILPRSFELSTYFQQEITPELISSWLSQMKYQSVDVEIPKFKFSYGTLELKPFLKEMGMTEAFTPMADFSAMTSFKRERLKLDQVAHKAFISVDEMGTEAAAATGASLSPAFVTMNPTTPISFNANHPFLFLILDHPTHSILFVGRFCDPPSQ